MSITEILRIVKGNILDMEIKNIYAFLFKFIVSNTHLYSV